MRFNRIKLAVLSFVALAFAAPIGFCTANATDAHPALEEMKVDDLKALAASKNVEIPSDAKKADIIAALQKAGAGGEETQEQRIARLEAHVQRLTAASTVALPMLQTAAPTGTTALLIQGAGVDAKEVTWRMNAGLSAAHAVEVALQEKTERERAAAGASK